jgi:hypothetical protein
MVGSEDIGIRIDNGHVYLTYTGPYNGFCQFSEMVNCPLKVIEYMISDTYVDQNGKSIHDYGGGVTGMANNGSGHIQIYVMSNAGQICTDVFGPISVFTSHDGAKLTFTDDIADAHEFGHAWGLFWGLSLEESKVSAVNWENRQRKRHRAAGEEGFDNYRSSHDPTFPKRNRPQPQPRPQPGKPGFGIR